MLRLHWSLVGLFLTVVAAAVVMPEEAGAYDAPCHTYVTDQADSIFSFPELQDWSATVIDGSSCEDSEEHIYPSGGSACGHTVRHFWNADDPDNFDLHLCLGHSYVNAWMKGRRLLNAAIVKYDSYINSGSYVDIDSAYHYLGHVVHMITDMGAPCHAKVDYHGVDDACYEEWMAGSDDGTVSQCDKKWGWEDAVGRYGAAGADAGHVASTMAYLGGDCWEPKILQACFYYLMYVTQQTADYFASDDYDGDSDDRLGFMNYGGWPSAPRTTDHLDDNDDDPDNDAHGHLTTIGNYCYTKTMWSAAALFRAWRDFWDHVRPTTGIDISGAAEVHDGWRPGDVVVALMGDDDSGGSAIHDSGVHEIQWKIDDGDWQSIVSAIVLFPITAEGITRVYYQSMDRFGNLEFTQDATIKIDKTPPEVSIISPEPDGFYLTSGSLTIDFEMSDVPSGIYSFSADMDGDPVSDGQVFDDLKNMAGFHTVTVTAEDFAGNTTTESVTFSIKIDATVEISPEPMNTESMATSMKAEVGFPPEYDVEMIDVSATTLEVVGQSFPADLWPANVGGYGPDGLPARIMEFERRDVCAVLTGVTAFVEMIVAGTLTEPIEYYGADTVEVFTPSRTKLGIAPSKLVIEETSPNPIGGKGVIRFGLPKDGRVEISLYDVSGRLVTNIVDAEYPAGYHTVDWKADDSLSNGLYLVRLRLGSEAITSKTVVWR